mgnify:CR=1 FL=1
MNQKTGWAVVAVVVVAGALFYFWPRISAAPAPADPYISTPSQEVEQSAMLGTWRSSTDAKFTREIDADGVMIDRYEGEASAGINGEWSFVDPATVSGLAMPAASLAGLKVVKVVWEGGAETTYFAVNKLDEKSMTTTDLTGTGSVTVYAKI